jgi:hypothetical protein
LGDKTVENEDVATPSGAEGSATPQAATAPSPTQKAANPEHIGPEHFNDPVWGPRLKSLQRQIEAHAKARKDIEDEHGKTAQQLALVRRVFGERPDIYKMANEHIQGTGAPATSDQDSENEDDDKPLTRREAKELENRLSRLSQADLALNTYRIKLGDEKFNARRGRINEVLETIQKGTPEERLEAVNKLIEYEETLKAAQEKPKEEPKKVEQAPVPEPRLEAEGGRGETANPPEQLPNTDEEWADFALREAGMTRADYMKESGYFG